MILRGSIFSKTLEMNTGVTIVTPANHYDSEHYQVAYVLHGLCGDHSDLVDFTMLPTFANEYHCILVMPDARRSFYTDMVYGQNYFSYIAEELPEICKDIFRISARKKDTFIIGVSIGGYGALKTALTYPEKYGGCCSISAGCLFLKDFLSEMNKRQNENEFIKIWGEQFINDFRAAFGPEFKWEPKIELMELAKNISAEGAPNLYLTCGIKDELLEPNRKFIDQIRPLKLPFTYEEYEGSHDWYFFNDALRRSLAFCCE